MRLGFPDLPKWETDALIIQAPHLVGFSNNTLYYIDVVCLSILQYIFNKCIVSLMKMVNIVPRAGLEPTSLAFHASVLPLHHIGFPGVTNTVPMPTCLCSSLPQTPVQTSVSAANLDM